jgi:lipopolysaccharide assembly protein A
MRIVHWVLIAAGAVICAAFAISNRPMVSLGLWPLPFAVDLPLYLLVFAALLIGFVLGVIATWLGGRHRRRELRRSRRRIGTLEGELAASRRRRGNAPVSAGPAPAGD